MYDINSTNIYTGLSQPPTPNTSTVRGGNTLAKQQLEYNKEKDKQATKDKTAALTEKANTLGLTELDLAQLKQADTIVKQAEAYENEVTQMMLDSKEFGTTGRFTAQEDMDLKSKRMVIYRAFNNAKEAQEKYLKAEADAVTAGKNNELDEDEWKKRQAEFAKGGKWNYDTIAPRTPLDIVSAIHKFATEKYGTTKGKNVVYNGQAGVAWIDPKDEKGITDTIDFVVLNNNRARTGLYRRWDALGVEGQKGFIEQLDADPTISEEEKENAILNFAHQDKSMREAAMGFNANTSTKEDMPKKGTVIATIGGTRMEMSPGILVRDRTYGGKKYPVAFAFGTNPTISGIPTKDAVKLSGKWADDVDPGSVNAKLILYDHIKHVFLVEAVTASASSGTESKALLEVPESSIVGWETIPLWNDKGIYRAEFWRKEEVSQETPSNQQVDLKL